MNAGQYEGLLNLIAEIRDRMPEPVLTRGPRADQVIYDDPPPVRTGWLHERPGPAPVPTSAPTRGVTRNQVEEGAYLALVTMLQALDYWIQGAKENHEALDHRGENTGEECWRSFDPSDIRRMVNDVARELGLSEFPTPEVPKEDTY